MAPRAKRERGLTVDAGEDGLLAAKLSEEDGRLYLRAGTYVWLAPPGNDYYDAVRSLQAQMEEQLGWRAGICGNCRYFHFALLSRELTAGVTGYCLVNKLGQELTDVDTVDVVDVCRLFSYGPGEERDAWAARWRASRGLSPE
ncbi:MAG TPA: hypothetical protein VM536_19655 [Chloroflexia bacterium]|nr:hypothetical protein [Chloroflexia bacterium]